jgi:rod shape-determining protein MreD
LLLQVFILDRLLLHGFLTPYVYVLIVLSLPFTFPTAGAMIIGFLMGIGIDFFLDTGGMHALAMVVVAYTRPTIIRIMRPPEGYDPDDRPTLASMGPGWFLTYAAVCVALHHFIYFGLEVLSFSYLLYFLKKWLITSLATLVLIVLVQLSGWRKKT